MAVINGTLATFFDSVNGLLINGSRFDTWEGQIELSQDSSSPKKTQSINDLLLEVEDDFDEFSVLSPSFLQKTPQSGAFLRQASLPNAHFSSKFDNNFHSAHTLFWNQHSHDSSSEDVS